MDAEDNTRFSRPVTCSWCGNKHRSVLPDEIPTTTAGDACATHVWQVTEDRRTRLVAEGVETKIGEWMANGGYGANWLDCTLWRWVNNPPTAEAAPVCDNCIGERISAGDLERIEGNFP